MCLAPAVDPCLRLHTPQGVEKDSGLNRPAKDVFVKSDEHVMDIRTINYYIYMFFTIAKCLWLMYG